MAPSLIQMMSKNPKRNGFFIVSVITAIGFTYDYSITRDVMKVNCQRAARYGDEKIKDPKQKNRHITVILNPVACKRKSKKLYTKWVEPLLHLAGIKVSLVETDSPGQAFKLMEVMTDCDGVALVGGDGTVHEALNGLLNRNDRARAAKAFPIAIIPTGQINSIARYIHQSLAYRNQKELLVLSTMRLIESTSSQFDVLEVKPLQASTDVSAESIYVLRDLRYGKYQDNYLKLSGIMTYQTLIKPLYLRFKSIFSNPNPLPRIEHISYTRPCEGCSKCAAKHTLTDRVVETPDTQLSTNRKWWSAMAPMTRKGPTEEELKRKELSKRENPQCDKWIEVENVPEISDFRASMTGDKIVRLSLSSNGEYEPSQMIETKDVRLKVAADLDEAFLSKQKVEKNSNQDELWKDANLPSKSAEKKDDMVEFLMNGQKAQVRSVNISPISKAVTIFTGDPKLV